MNPIIVDPNNYDKKAAYDEAVKYCNRFLKINKIPKPARYLTSAPWFKPRVQRYYGWYQFSTKDIFVNVKLSRPPVKTPGYSWSYTGCKADLTAPGILAHEVGHHVQITYEDALPIRERKIFRQLLKKISKKESKVSSYEPNIDEMFAEASRLFILNPDLLKNARPVRYALMTEVMGLKPLHNVPWREVLQNAHPRLIQSIEKWMNK